MEGYKTLFTCNAGISLLNMGIKFGAWTEEEQGNDPVDNRYVFKIFVPEADIELVEEGSYDIVNLENVIVEGEE